MLGKDFRIRPPPDKRSHVVPALSCQYRLSSEVIVLRYNPPRQARVNDQTFRQFGLSLSLRGLASQEFRAIGESEDHSVVYHGDPKNPRPLRKDIVEFPPEE